MTLQEIKDIQKKVGTNPDGFWGPESIEDCQKYLCSIMPSQRWPGSDEKSLQKFYGEPGDEENLVVVKFPFPVFYDNELVKTTRVHEKCADSFLRILQDVWDRHQGDTRIIHAIQRYSGCFNFRKKRGGSTLSVHAYGAAVDFDDLNNSFHSSWPMKAAMPFEIVEAFAREGWKSAGAFWGYDAMHFQATV